MSELLSLDLVDKDLVTDQIILNIGYDNTGIPRDYHGDMVKDHYGRQIPKSANGSINLDRKTSSTRLIMQAATSLYDEIVDKRLLIRRINISANKVIPRWVAQKEQEQVGEQLDLFTDYKAESERQAQEEQALEREHNMQQALLEIKRKFGKNAVLKGMNLVEGATTIERNGQVGGHKA